jgi:hypothetical protein
VTAHAVIAVVVFTVNSIAVEERTMHDDATTPHTMALHVCDEGKKDTPFIVTLEPGYALLGLNGFVASTLGLPKICIALTVALVLLIKGFENAT